MRWQSTMNHVQESLEVFTVQRAVHRSKRDMGMHVQHGRMAVALMLLTTFVVMLLVHHRHVLQDQIRIFLATFLYFIQVPNVQTQGASISHDNPEKYRDNIMLPNMVLSLYF